MRLSISGGIIGSAIYGYCGRSLLLRPWPRNARGLHLSSLTVLVHFKLFFHHFLWPHSQREGVGDEIKSATKLEDGKIDSGTKSKEGVLDDEDSAWFDEKRFFAEMKAKLEENRTSAFRYNGNAYYTLDTVARALNRQRRDKSLEPMQPQAVIDFFQANRILKSGKYVMRFDVGLPVKIYLYSHACQASKNSKDEPPITENGRRLKNIKPMDQRGA